MPVLDLLHIQLEMHHLQACGHLGQLYKLSNPCCKLVLEGPDKNIKALPLMRLAN